MDDIYVIIETSSVIDLVDMFDAILESEQITDKNASVIITIISLFLDVLNTSLKTYSDLAIQILTLNFVEIRNISIIMIHILEYDYIYLSLNDQWMKAVKQLDISIATSVSLITPLLGTTNNNTV